MKSDRLKNVITEYLSNNYKAYNLRAICESYGIICDNNLEPMASKRTYIKSGLIGLTLESLQSIAINIAQQEDSPEFVKAIDSLINTDPFKISMITRRSILDMVSSNYVIEGQLQINEFLNRIWPLKDIPSAYGYTNAEEDIIRHMIRNDDLSYSEMFNNLLIIYRNDNDFKNFLEQLVHPCVRDSVEEQLQYVKEINDLLLEDGYSLISTHTLSGQPIFTLDNQTGSIKSPVKNIIFASITKKPDIVIADSLSNELNIIDNDYNDCLIYNYPTNQKGLSWNDLVRWWNKGREPYDIVIEQQLYERLKKALDSEAEKIFMREYYNYLHTKNNSLPALIPQVYCHYDPKSAKLRGGRLYVHQRMDFLMLLPKGERIVIEIDGKQHYSDNNEPSPKLYAEMVSDDRNLKLYGYDVYRFGGYEFINTIESKKLIQRFFEQLFLKYGIDTCN